MLLHFKESIANQIEVILLSLLFIAALSIRIYNLNYNSPFSDEALYVVIGKMGIFQHDWFTYSAKNWMGGLSYIYPSISAVAYESGGILGSRFLNIFFSLFTLVEVYKLTQFFEPSQNILAKRIAPFVAVLTVAFSTVSLIVSRLATYDGLSFFFLVYSTNHLLRADTQDSGKFYFIAALTMIMSFYSKIITGIFIPFLIAISFLRIMRNKAKFLLWRRYFLYPLITGFLIYAYINITGLLSFASSQIIREHVESIKILNEILFYTKILIPLSLFSGLIVGMRYKKWQNVLFLVFFALLIPFLHLVTHRFATVNKHLLLTVIFLAPLIGYGFAYLLTSKVRWIQVVTVPFLIIFFCVYPYFQYRDLMRVEHQWVNTDHAFNELAKIVHENDKVLTETGPATALALYDTISPAENVTTLDWFEYGKLKDNDAYIQAVRDGYFEVIELSGTSEAKKDLVAEIRVALKDKYILRYQETPFQIYERSY